MNELDPEVRTMQALVEMNPAVRSRVLNWATEKFQSNGTAPQAAPATRPARVAKVKTPKAAKPAKRARKARAPGKGDANRNAIYEAVKAVAKEGKASRADVVNFLKEKNFDKNALGNLSNYLKTLTTKNLLKVEDEGATITLIQG